MLELQLRNLVKGCQRPFSSFSKSKNSVLGAQTHVPLPLSVAAKSAAEFTCRERHAKLSNIQSIQNPKEWGSFIQFPDPKGLKGPKIGFRPTINVFGLEIGRAHV